MQFRSPLQRARGSGHGEASTLLWVTVAQLPDDEIDNGPGARLSARRTESFADRASEQALASVLTCGRCDLGSCAERAGALLSAPRLERRPVEEPDGQSAHRDDAKKDQHERDVRLTLGIVLSEAVHSYVNLAELWRIEALTS